MTPDGSQPRRTRGRPRTGERVEPSEILRVAGELIAQRGIDAVNVGDIAEAAGVDRASVYYHFGDRSAVRRALGRSVFDRLLLAIEHAESCASPAERLAAYLMIEHNELVPHRRVVVQLLSEGADTDLAAEIAVIDTAIERWLLSAHQLGELEEIAGGVGLVNAVALGSLIEVPRDDTERHQRVCSLLRALGASNPSEIVGRAARVATRLGNTDAAPNAFNVNNPVLPDGRDDAEECPCPRSACRCIRSPTAVARGRG